MTGLRWEIIRVAGSPGCSCYGMSDVSIKKRMGITFTDLNEMKRNIRRQIESAFAAC